jgi:sulfatase maturation enzyme AslB (radical SAM superfamily)
MTSWYCPLPFKHAFVDSTGVGACCQTPRYPVDLSSWQTHPQLLDLQTQLLNNQQPTICKACQTQELRQNRSLRTDSITDYSQTVFDQTNIDFIDYRASNICNFKCRSCSPQFSHGINQELNNYQELQRFYGNPIDTKTVSVTENNAEWILKNLSQISRLMFTGGEPTVMPGVKEIITQVKQHYKDKINILITTNASFVDNFWFDVTKDINNLHWTVSIDAVGSAAEIIRHGTDWITVEKNVSWLAKNANSLDINTVVSNLNVFQLAPLLKFARTMQHQSASPIGRHGNLGCRHQFFVAQRPYYLAADNWPQDLQDRAVEYLKYCATLDLDDEQQSTINGLIQSLINSTFDQSLWDQTQKYNDLLNEIRNENHLTLYKESL